MSIEPEAAYYLFPPDKMSAGNLDAIKKKYNFKELKVATWKDPKLSVHPFRGGPKPPSVSPESVSRPFVPTYKVRIARLPEPTDDEDSEDDEDEDEGEGESLDDAKTEREREDYFCHWR